MTVNAYNPDFSAPEIQGAIDAVAAEKTAEVVEYFQKVAQVAVFNATTEADRPKLADDQMSKIANGPLPGAMIASLMMHEVVNNKQASLASAAEIGALREKTAAGASSKAGKSMVESVRKIVSKHGPAAAGGAAAGAAGGYAAGRSSKHESK